MWKPIGSILDIPTDRDLRLAVLDKKKAGIKRGG